MVDVIEIAGAEALPAGDGDVVVVWPTLAGPAYGTRAAFNRSRVAPSARVSPSDWAIAVDKAKAAAAGAALPAVYVIGRPA